MVAIRGKSICVHVLIAETFIGPRKKGDYVRHLDDDPTNNNLANIAYGTPAENADDRERNGKYAKGEAVKTAKLTLEQVEEIKHSTASCKSLAGKFGVGRETVRLIRIGKSWRHVQ